MIDSLLLLIKFYFFSKLRFILAALPLLRNMTRCAIVGGWAACRGPPPPLLPCPSTIAPRRRFGSLPPPLLLPLRSPGCCLALACGLARRAAEARRRCRSVAARHRAARRHRGAGGYDQGHGPARTGVGHHYAGGHGLAPRAGTAEPVGRLPGPRPRAPRLCAPASACARPRPRRRARPRQRLRLAARRLPYCHAPPSTLAPRRRFESLPPPLLLARYGIASRSGASAVPLEGSALGDTIDMLYIFLSLSLPRSLSNCLLGPQWRRWWWRRRRGLG
jgi:hypothetical protein